MNRDIQLRLSSIRVLLYSAAFLFFIFGPSEVYFPSEWFEVSAFWYPFSFFRYFTYSQWATLPLDALMVGWYMSLFLSAIGLWARWSMLASFFLALPTLGFGINFGTVEPAENILLMTFLLLALSPSAERLSVDSWLRKLKGVAKKERERWEFEWPIKMAKFLYVWQYFSAGLQKLVINGWDWSLSGYPVFLLNTMNSSAGQWLAENAFSFISLFGLGVIILEISAPLVLIFKRTTYLYLFLLVVMQLNFLILLNIPFYLNYILLIVWVPWDKVRIFSDLKEPQPA